ncbi:MAG: hypothetical protein ACI8Y7_000703 [Candidatus Woesearchaeota archaeon]|jgi:hypothetical protein
MNKQGVELSINFIVMLILAITLFSISMVMIKQFTSDSADLSNQLNDGLKEKLLDISCNSRNTICISNNNQIIKEDGFYHFGIVVRNDFDTTLEYEIIVTPLSATISGERTAAILGSLGWGEVNLAEQFQNSSLLIEPKTQDGTQASFVIGKTASPGQYIYKVRVQPKDEEAIAETIVFTVE